MDTQLYFIKHAPFSLQVSVGYSCLTHVCVSARGGSMVCLVEFCESSKGRSRSPLSSWEPKEGRGTGALGHNRPVTVSRLVPDSSILTLKSCALSV